ncbi:MAG: FAD-dependent oxidoreductase [Candidatus Omnitrophota bacterium]|nr:MAG: FAD-dependent oxidoreductase [Candidatus Omnitrophota bacterium]
MRDLIIVGGGAAGLAAGIYAARYKLHTLLISKPGGAALDAPWVENYPGFDSISGMELISKFEKQVKDLGVEVIGEEVKSITKKGDEFVITTNKKDYESKTVILALGREKNKLDVPGEADYAGKGVSYCATCDAPLFSGKIAGVVGGANSAAKSALLLAEHAKGVYIIYRRDKLRAEPIITEKIEKNLKIEVIYKANVKEIKGEKMVNKVVLDNGKELELDGLFVEIGSTPSTGFLKGLVDLNENGYIKVDCEQKTNIKGVFAAGDVTVGGCNRIRQIITSAAEGVLAATAAYEYLR